MIEKILLAPYYITLSARHWMYDHGWKKSAEAGVPTVCVGNVTVGGTGKTPHAEMILRTLLASDRWAYSNIAVLSRGYKRRSKGFQKVDRSGSAALFGDEPLQIAKKFPVITVADDADRIEGCRFLTHPEELQTSKKARRCMDKDIPRADIILLDDAFQYRKLRATVNVVLVDYNRPVHKDALLPLGRLRDLPGRLKAADILIVTKCPAYLDAWERSRWANNLGLKDFNPTTCEAVNKAGKKVSLFFTGIDYGEMTPVFPEADARFIYAKRLILFTGIAKDTPMVNFLSDKYSIVRRMRFPDHHKYSGADIRTIEAAIRENPTALVCTTEKDAQRIVDAKRIPDALKQRLFQLPIEVFFLTPEEREIFTAQLETLLQKGSTKSI